MDIIIIRSRCSSRFHGKKFIGRFTTLWIFTSSSHFLLQSEELLELVEANGESKNE